MHHLDSSTTTDDRSQSNIVTLTASSKKYLFLSLKDSTNAYSKCLCILPVILQMKQQGTGPRTCHLCAPMQIRRELTHPSDKITKSFRSSPIQLLNYRKTHNFSYAHKTENSLDIYRTQQRRRTPINFHLPSIFDIYTNTKLRDSLQNIIIPHA